jgi:hypothetical protein
MTLTTQNLVLGLLGHEAASQCFEGMWRAVVFQSVISQKNGVLIHNVARLATENCIVIKKWFLPRE